MDGGQSDVEAASPTRRLQSVLPGRGEADRIPLELVQQPRAHQPLELVCGLEAEAMEAEAARAQRCAALLIRRALVGHALLERC